jgi:DNA-binding MarR family transcriptional regulator
MGRQDWHHVSSHGAVIYCIAAAPDCTTKEIAEALCVTTRTVWGIIGDLRRAGMIRVRKEGRRHHYTVNPDAPLRHPTLKRFTLRAILGDITAQAAQRDGRRKQLTAARS